MSNNHNSAYCIDTCAAIAMGLRGFEVMLEAEQEPASQANDAMEREIDSAEIHSTDMSPH